MRSANILIFAVAALAATVSFAADLSYVAVDSVRSWDTASAWSGGALPTSSDTVRLDDSSIVIPDYLRVTNNVTAYAKELHIGESATDGDGLVGLKVEQGGTLTIPASREYNLVVGDYGRGALWLDGGTVAAAGWNVAVGYHAGSYGELTIGTGSFFNQSASSDKQIFVGLKGVGKMATYADLGYNSLKIRIGGNTAAMNTLLAAGSTVKTMECQIGGVAWYGEYVDSTASGSLQRLPGYGTLTLSNATLRVMGQLPNSTTSAQLTLGKYSGSLGILRGFGIVRSQDDSNLSTVRIWMDNGQIIADGFGEEHALDLNTVVSIGTNDVNAATAGTTNGWYAVNKGVVLFPRVYFATAEKTTVLGGWNADTVPGFVNSVGVSVSGMSSNAHHLRGGFFASDRSDIHADSLPSGQTIVGVWKLGITSSLQGTTDVQSYTSASLDFRYDQSKVKAGETLSLYRWTGSAWSRETSKSADSTYRISVSGIEPQTAYDGIYNIGTFALLRKPVSGMMVIFK